jgi:hypothetical protein
VTGLDTTFGSCAPSKLELGWLKGVGGGHDHWTVERERGAYESGGTASEGEQEAATKRRRTEQHHSEDGEREEVTETLLCIRSEAISP